MILFDTTVLAYAAGGEHPLRLPCRRLIEGIQEGRLSASTTPEVVQEFMHVHARRPTRADAARLGRSYVEGLAPLIVTEAADVRRGSSIFERSETIDAFDAVLAAVAFRVRAEALVSADRAFSEVEGLRHLDPHEVSRLYP